MKATVTLDLTDYMKIAALVNDNATDEASTYEVEYTANGYTLFIEVSHEIEYRAERAIRPIALSRKNFMFCGNHRSAADTAVICSILASCKERGVNPRAYLTDILARLPYYTCPGAKLDLGELLPHRWLAKEHDTDVHAL